MAKSKKKLIAKGKKDIFETEDFDIEDEEKELSNEEDSNIGDEDPSPELLKEEEIVDTDINSIVEDPDEEIQAISEIESDDDEEKEDEEEDIDTNKQKNVIVKCPHCGEEVLEMETCPVCGKPLKLTLDNDLSREDYDDLDAYDFDEESDTIKSELKKDSINSGTEEELFGGLSYQPAPDKYSPNDPDNI